MGFFEKLGLGRKEAADGSQGGNKAAAADSVDSAAREMKMTEDAEKLAERLTAPYAEALGPRAKDLQGELYRTALQNMKLGSDPAVTERLLTNVLEKRVGKVAPASETRAAVKGVASENELKLAKTLSEQKGNPAALRRLINESIQELGTVAPEDAQRIANNIASAEDPIFKSFIEGAKADDAASLERLVAEIQRRAAVAVGAAEQRNVA